MSLKDIEIKKEYRNLHGNIVKDFFNPLLGESVLYKRSVGFFSSTALACFSVGLCKFLQNGGKIQLVASPKLSDEDIKAMQEGYKKRKIIEDSLLRELHEPNNFLQNDRLNMLANLIAEERMDIKIAFTESGMYHEKLGVIEDAEKNYVAFSGSLNESENAFKNNYETIDVYCSWNDSENRAFSKKQAFENIWTGNDETLKLFDFPKLKDEIVGKYKKSEPKFDMDEKEVLYMIPEPKNIEVHDSGKTQKVPTMPDWLKLHDYQKEAIDKWAGQKYRGIFDMATGTGKTLTGLSAMTRLFHDKFPEKLFAIIVCPYQHLVEQWVEDIVKFNIQPIVGYSASPQKDWKTRLKKAILDMKLRPKEKRFACLVTTNATFKSKFVQEQINAISDDTLLMIDEAHNAGAGNFKKYLDSRFKYRLALSATLDRHNDEEGTAFLHSYFENVCIHYDLERAIDEKKLTRYKYFPVVVYLTEDELDEYKQISREMSQHLRKNKSGKMVLDSYGKMLAIKRSRVVAGAQNKLDALREQIKPYKNQNNLLVYCGATTVIPEKDKDELLNDFDKSEVGERQITAVTKILGNEMEMTVSKFTSEEDIETRKIITQKFKEEKIQAIVAIKCLDEGVNIPSIKTAFILASTTNPKEYIQRRGRVLRKFEGKDYAEIYDFVTLPRELESVQNYTKEELQGDLGLVKNELRRIREFSHISMNAMDSLSLMDEIQTVYQISDKDLFENNSQEEEISE